VPLSSVSHIPNRRSKPRFAACLALLGTALAWLGCGPQARECAESIASTAQGIYGGSPDASSVGLDNVAAATVAAIVVESDAGPPGLCSGVLVAQRFVLTAAHCAPGATPAAVRVSFGPSAAPFANGTLCAPFAPTYAVVALERDPNADVMLVELASDISPASIAPIVSTPPTVGQAATIAGYGLNDQNTAGEKLFVGTTVVAVGREVAGYSQPDAEADADRCTPDADARACSEGPLLITVDSGLDAGACTGDSGGPLFVRNASGWQLAGVLSEGSAYCTGQDVYVDITSVAGWISTQITG
jgi:secreted trypsin-like serine protease